MTDITPTITLNPDHKIHLLELFHGPTFAFKDVALQFLGNLFEFFLTRKNEGRTGKDREHLTVVGATSGDTGVCLFEVQVPSFGPNHELYHGP